MSIKRAPTETKVNAVNFTHFFFKLTNKFLKNGCMQIKTVTV